MGVASRFPCLRFSNGGFEEEAERRAGERGGASQKAEQRGAGLTDHARPTTVSGFKSGQRDICMLGEIEEHIPLVPLPAAGANTGRLAEKLLCF